MCADLDVPSYARDSANAEAVANLLVAYLADDADNDPNTVARAVLAQFPIGPGSTSYESWCSYLCYFWAIVYHLAKQISCDDAMQPKLISLLLTIREQPPPANIPPEFLENKGERFWTDLPMWRSVWVDFEDDAPFRPSMEDRRAMQPGASLSGKGPWHGHKRHSRDEWTNLNAFQARLHTAAPDLHLGDIIGLFAQLEALEEDYRDAVALEELVPAAACWIIYAGVALRASATDYPPYIMPEVQNHRKRVPWSRGTLYKGTPCFNDEHWSFWKRRYTIILSRGDLSPQTRNMVSRALQKLDILGV